MFEPDDPIDPKTPSSAGPGPGPGADSAGDPGHAVALLSLQFRIADALKALGDPQAVLARVLDAFMAAEGIDCGAVYAPDAVAENLALVACRGLSAASVDAVRGWAAEWSRAPSSEWAPDGGIRGVAVLPAVHDGRLRALVVLGSHAAGGIPERSRAVLGEVAGHVAEVVAVVEAQRALRERERDLDSLVAERDRTAFELRNERDFARLVMDTMAQGLTVTDASGRFVYVNEACARMLGLPSEQIVGRTPAEFVADDDRAEFLHGRTERRRGHASNYETRLVRPDGQLVPVMITDAPWWRGDEMAGAIAVVTDLTLHKRSEDTRLRLERQMQEAQRRSSLGTMAGGIAHHFNNLLTVMLGNLHLAMSDLGVGTDAAPALNEALRAGERAARISEMMLTYVGQRVGRSQPALPFQERLPLLLAPGIERILTLVRSGLAPNITFEADLPVHGPSVMMETEELEQVVVNLVMNAAEAIGDEPGTIAVSLRSLPETGTRGEWALDRLACLEVRDTGHGMDPETRERMFDPFFTTRMTGRGLGLAVALGIVQSRQGTITVDTAPGAGTTIRVLLPVSPGPFSPPA
jgi:PAS domain S-box-containing protein